MVTLLLLYAASVPFTFRLLGVTVSPADFWLLLMVLLGGWHIVIVRRAWGAWLPLLSASIAIGAGAAFLFGEFTNYVLLNKILGFVGLLLLFAAITSTMRTGRDLRMLLSTLVTSTSIVTLVSLLIYVTPARSIVTFSATRLQGFQVDPNAFSGLAVTALILIVADPELLAFSRIRRPYGSSTVVVTELVLLAGIMLSSSRSAWIGALAGVVLTVYVAPSRRVGGSLLLISVAMYTAYAFSSPAAVSEFVVTATRTSQITARVDLIRDAFASFLDAPVAGIGLGQFYVAHGWIVHNSFMWLLAETGILGGIAFLGTVASFLFRGIAVARRSTDSRICSLAVAAASAHLAMFVFSFGIEALYQRQWWLILGTLGALAAMRPGSDSASRGDLPPN